MGSAPRRVTVTARTELRWSPEGLAFRDDAGAERWASFAACNARWPERAAEAGIFLAEDATSSCVAWRDITAPVPYVEFFEDPPVRLEFPRPRSWVEALRPSRWGWRERFGAARRQIFAMGWRSYDLS